MSAVLKRTEPTRHLCGPIPHVYVPANSTDVAATWAKWRAANEQPETAESYALAAMAEHNGPRIPGND